MTYQRINDDKLIDTSNFMHPLRYKELWKLIELYNKSDDYTLRAWEVFEDALNKVLKDTCIPTKGEFKMVVTTDDDKHWYNHSVHSVEKQTIYTLCAMLEYSPYCY